MLKKYAIITLTCALSTIPVGAVNAQCERWLVRDEVTNIEPNEIRFGVQGGGAVSSDPAEATAAIVEAARAMASDVELHICVPNQGQLVIHAAAASRPL